MVAVHSVKADSADSVAPSPFAGKPILLVGVRIDEGGLLAPGRAGSAAKRWRLNIFRGGRLRETGVLYDARFGTCILRRNSPVILDGTVYSYIGVVFLACVLGSRWKDNVRPRLEKWTMR